MAAKVDGAVALMALTQRDPLRWFVGFGSLSGRFGGNGLSDYAAANDMLAKLIAAFRRRRPQCAAACIHWQTWDEVGMANLGRRRGDYQERAPNGLHPAPGRHRALASRASRGAAQLRDCRHRRAFPADLLSRPTSRSLRQTRRHGRPSRPHGRPPVSPLALDRAGRWPRGRPAGGLPAVRSGHRSVLAATPLAGQAVLAGRDRLGGAGRGGLVGRAAGERSWPCATWRSPTGCCSTAPSRSRPKCRWRRPRRAWPAR